MCSEAPEAALSLLVGQAVHDVLGHPLNNTDDTVSFFMKSHPKRVAAAVATIITFQVCAIIWSNESFQQRLPLSLIPNSIKTDSFRRPV